MKRYVTLLLLLASLIFADGYKLPPKAILDVFDAPDDQFITAVTGTDKVIEYTYSRYESLEQLSQEKLSLAGKIIYIALHSEKNSYPYKYLKLRDLNSDFSVMLNPEEDNKIVGFKISPDRNLLAYTAEKNDGVFIRIVDLNDGKMIFKDTRKVNMSLAYLALQWSVDSKHLIIPRIYYEGNPVPQISPSEIAPRIQESYGKVSQVRTYSNLLETAFDVRLFDHFFTSIFVILDPFTGKELPIGEPGIYRSFDESPDGKYYLVKKVNNPYSFTVPYYRFAYTFNILDKEGRQFKELVSKPIQDQIPIGGVETGIRQPQWIPSENATIWWTEAQDEGDPKKQVAFRDKFYKYPAPFNKKAELFLKTKNRGYVSGFTKDKGALIYLDYDRDKEWLSTYYGSYDGSIDDKLLFSRSDNEKYEDPGEFVTEKLTNGFEVIKVRNNNVFLYGQGYSPEGNFPFLNKFDLGSGKLEQLFRSPPETYETFSSMTGNDEKRIIIRHETPTEPRNYFILDIGSGNREQITKNIDHAPQIRDIKTELVTYFREDSIQLSGKLYLPPDYDPDKRYPLYINAYPREFTDVSTASQVSGSQYTYTRFWGASIIYLTLHGYVVLNGAAMPVIGDVDTRNDTFVKQIGMNAKAAIDYLDMRGMIDRERVAVGGHSYGAFMTANLLAYTDYFKAGIAKSGAYNRTLTPFGFQSEERPYWEAKEFYQKASPFMNAEKIKTPLLLIHGADDDNAGTYPMQSERMYAAVKGNGGDVKLVMLPYEGHGYQARESNLHVLYEICEWLDKYLKND
ncbi:MAG: S9 family peptidase [Candidatus Delongbacteria bacterium]|nr:S9 family peptidase [Candidatus Delongbacteria bacterium]